MSFLHSVKRVPMLYLLLILCTGIIIEDAFLRFYDRSTWIICLSSCLALLCSLLIIEKIRFRRFVATRIIALLTILILGMSLTAFQNIKSDPRWFGHRPGAYTALCIEVREEPVLKPKTVLLTVNVLSGLKEGCWKPLSGSLQLYVYRNGDSMPFKTGERYIIPNKLLLMKHNNNPYSFDFVQKRQREGFYYQSFLSREALLACGNAVPKGGLSLLRQSLLDQLDLYIPEKTTCALTKATLLNETADLDAFMQNAYAATGITHIIAISGMHVQLLFVLFLIPFFWIRDKRKLWIKYLIVLPFVWLYVALCHFPPSAIRAAVGFSLIALALLLRRQTNPIQLWALTAFVMLCCNPMWLFHVGVQLSFLAVLSILLFYRPVQKLIYIPNVIGRWIWDTIAISCSVQILVFPLVIYYFHQFPIWFLPANFFAALFSFLLMVLALAIMLLGALSWSLPAAFLGKVLVWLTNGFHQLILFFNSHTPDLARGLPLDALDYLLLMAAIGGLCIFWLHKHKWSLFAGLSILLLFLINLMLQDWLAVKQEKIIVYAGNNHALIDLIQGRTAQTYSDEPLSAEQEQFILKPAHLAYRIHTAENIPLSNTEWHIRGKRIVLLEDLGGRLPSPGMDYLIISADMAGKVGDIEELEPGAVIINSAAPRGKTGRAATVLAALGLRVHNVYEDGAWIFEK